MTAENRPTTGAEPDDEAVSAPSAQPRSCVQSRAVLAGQVPFFLRVWLLRDRVENEHLVFGEHSLATLPLFSMHSDPLCDSANMDVSVL